MTSIHIIKKLGGSLTDSYLEEGFILDKQIGVGQPKRIENPKILVANTPMDTDKIKIYGIVGVVSPSLRAKAALNSCLFVFPRPKPKQVLLSRWTP